jgi:hypothetical protein
MPVDVIFRTTRDFRFADRHTGIMQRGRVDTRSIIPEFETEGAGTLTLGSEFELKLNTSAEEGGNWSAWVFHGVVEHPLGGKWVSAFGGDPVSTKKEPDHRRQWHSFDLDRVRTQAQPIRSTWSARRRNRNDEETN